MSSVLALCAALLANSGIVPPLTPATPHDRTEIRLLLRTEHGQTMTAAPILTEEMDSEEQQEVHPFWYEPF